MSDEDRSPQNGDPPPGSGGRVTAEELLARIREYDETLARDVRLIIERGAELHDVAGDLEETLEQRNAQIVELEATLNDREDRIEELEADLTDRTDRIEELEDELAERAERIEELAAELDDLQADLDDDGSIQVGPPADEDDDGSIHVGPSEDEDPGIGVGPVGAGEVSNERVAELERQLQERDETIADLRERLDDREEEIQDLTEKVRRKQADFENYKKRAERKREQIRERATEDLVERLLDVRDNLNRAIENDHDDVESVIQGVEMTLREFDRVLEEEDVEEIAPEPGTEIDPQQHEVMMRVDSDQPEDTVADLYAPGYRMADKVVRPAQVTVSTGPPDDEEEEAVASEDGSADEAATATARDGDE